MRSTPTRERSRALLDLGEAADYLSVTERYMRRLVAERRIRHRKVGHFVRFDVPDLDAFIEVREVAAR